MKYVLNLNDASNMLQLYIKTISLLYSNNHILKYAMNGINNKNQLQGIKTIIWS